MLKQLALAAALLAVFFGRPMQAGAESATAPIRPYPFPFTSVVTFSSDVDEQAPWHGKAIHKLINEQIGLPISDSIWVHGTSYEASSLFVGVDQRNDRPSQVDRLPTYALLLREWYRGNADHFHSWNDDNVPNMRNTLDQPIPVSSSKISVELPSNKVSKWSIFTNLRLAFDRPIPPDLSLVLHDKAGNTVLVPWPIVMKGKRVQAEADRGRYLTEILFGVSSDIGVPASANFTLRELTRIDLEAPSCAKACDVRLIAVERDAFSRLTALLELPWVKAWNLRPPLYTSHGGWTLAQDYAPAGTTFEMGRAPGSVYEDPAVNNIAAPLADSKTGHVYLSDILKELGIYAVWSYAGGEFNTQVNYFWSASPPKLNSHYAGFYDVGRTRIGNYNLGSLKTFERSLEHLGLWGPGLEASRIYCTAECTTDEGAMLAPMIATSFAQMRDGHPVEHHWYTHFAVGDLSFKRTSDQPLKPDAVIWLRHLAEAYYGFPAILNPPQRVWVPPASTYIRYRAMMAHIADHVTVENSSSAVAIMPWIDPVTSLRIPDAKAGTRDLDGLTIYVPSSAAASLTVDGTPSSSFTRNPPDATGRASITIVDDNTPTPILDRVPMAAVADVSPLSGKFVDADPARQGEQPFFRLIADASGVARTEIGLDDLALWNTSYMQLAYRKGAAGDAKPGRLRVELEMSDGGRIVLSEEGPAKPEDKQASRWVVPAVAAASDWTRATLATPDLRWGEALVGDSQRRPPLPIGRVKRVTLSLLDASPGATLDIAYLRALRESGNGESPDRSKLIGGRVTRLGDPASGINVELTDGAGNRSITTTDADGNYFYYGVARQQLVGVAALDRGHRCTPKMGAQMVVMRNDPEIDIDLDGCGRGSD